jgi:hypothetical protein
MTGQNRPRFAPLRKSVRSKRFEGVETIEVSVTVETRDPHRYLRFEARETLWFVDTQLYKGMVYLAGTKLNPSRFAPAERFESQQAKKIGP